MAYANYFYLLAILASFNLIFAQEVYGQAELGSEPVNPPENYQVPNEEKSARQSSMGFGQIPLFNSFGFIPDFGSFLGSSSFPSFGSNSQSGSFPSLGSFPNLGSFPGSVFQFLGSNGASTTAPSFEVIRSLSAFRDDDADNKDGNQDDEDSDEDGPQSRLFFSSLFNTRLTTCNYTTQAGTTCSSCRQVLTCFRSNVGKLRTCRKFFPYCNNGRCSLFPGAACSSAAATTDATTVEATTADATTVTTT